MSEATPTSPEPSLFIAAPVFAALGDDTRFHLVERLSNEGPLSITTLTEGTQVSRQAVTKHLQVLADAGIVSGVRHGREQRWSVNFAQLALARRCLERIGRRWDEALTRLRAHVEAPAEEAVDTPTDKT